MTTAFKCDVCLELKLGDAAAFGGEMPFKARHRTKRGRHTWIFTIFVSREGPTAGTAMPLERNLHVCHPCTRALLLEALAEDQSPKTGKAT